MQSSNEIIEEIKSDATSLQRKLMTLPGPGEDISKEQQEAVVDVQDGLSFWRRMHLVILEKAFKRKD